jgi:crotonobetainyl-CoA:carnitine CoA-transferase CaiB-like acyl-CoA transferase
MLLADLGADVVKVEPLTGDMAREFGPFVEGQSAFFLSVNRGKRSLAVDLKAEEARNWVVELARGSDVVFHNYRKGVAERLGLGYDDLGPSNPGLVYCTISAFGPDGPQADRPGIDLIFQGESGMMSITGEEGQGPQKTATNVADVYAGTNAALCITAALRERERTGAGRRVDVSLRDGLIAMQATWNALYFATGRQPPRIGTASPFTAPTQAFRTADGHLLLAIVSDRHWLRLCDTLGVAELANDPDFATNEQRVANRERLATIVADIFATDTTDAWLVKLNRAGLPAGRPMSFDEVFAAPQVRHNEMVVTYAHVRAGPIRVQGTPFWLDGDKPLTELPPPALGQHTRQVLGELGCPKDEIDRLAAAGLIAEIDS